MNSKEESKKLNKHEIKNLQLASIALIELIKFDIEQNSAAEGVFRLSASKKFLDATCDAIKADEPVDYYSMSQIELAALLKLTLRELNQKGGKPLFNAQQYNDLLIAKQQEEDDTDQELVPYARILQGTASAMNQRIACNLLLLLNDLTHHAEAKMTSYNIGVAIGMSIVASPVTSDLSKAAELGESVARTVQDLVDNAHNIKLPERSTHYKHMAVEQQKGRLHAFSAQKHNSMDFKELKDEHKTLLGDRLKSQILLDFKEKIESTQSPTELETLKVRLKASDEYKVLKKGQGLATKMFRLDTSSVRAFEKMINDQEVHLEANERIDGLKRQ